MSVDNSSDGGAWVVGRKYIVTPDSYGTEADGCGGPLRVRLRSPRLARALLECGVLLGELKELDECTFFGRYSADEQVVAEREWEEAEKLRIERLETVFAARRRGILAKGKQAESSNSDEKASRLLDRSSMLQREQEFVKRYESSRQRRAEFELSQSKLFAEQRQHTVDAAAHKTERAAATRRELEQRRLEADAARVAARARTQQRCVRGEGGSRRGLFPLFSSGLCCASSFGPLVLRVEEEQERRERASEAARQNMEQRDAAVARRARAQLAVHACMASSSSSSPPPPPPPPPRVCLRRRCALDALTMPVLWLLRWRVNRAQSGGSDSPTRSLPVCLSACLSVLSAGGCDGLGGQSRNATLQESSRLREQRGLASRSRCAELEAGRYAALAGSATALEKRMGTVSVMNTLSVRNLGRQLCVVVITDSHLTEVRMRARAGSGGRRAYRSRAQQRRRHGRLRRRATYVRFSAGESFLWMRAGVCVCVCVLGVV
eukprot:COSAG01_NODE_1372_length_10545_cov_12.262876_5_plen_492_part_00